MPQPLASPHSSSCSNFPLSHLACWSVCGPADRLRNSSSRSAGPQLLLRGHSSVHAAGRPAEHGDIAALCVQATVDSTPQISFRPMTARSIFSRDLLTFCANIFVSLLNPTLHTNGSRFCKLSDSEN